MQLSANVWSGVTRKLKPLGKARVKVCFSGERVLNALPEYQDCRDIALKSKVPLKEIYFRALAAYYGKGWAES